MTADVRIFYHSGVIAAPVSAASGQYSTDSVQMLQQPYIGRDRVSATDAGAISTNGQNASQATRLARVEVQPGKAVFMEVNSPNSNSVADTGSPMVTGNVTIAFGAGWKLSFLEADLA